MNMTGLYAFYESDHWENIAEFYRFNNRDISGATGTYNSNAGFAQVGYRVGKLTPYGRIERSKLDQNDLYFSGQENGFSYNRKAVGLKYDLDPRMAIKLELASTGFKDRDPRTGREALLQFAIRF